MKTRYVHLKWLIAGCFISGMVPAFAQFTPVPLSYYVTKVKDINLGAGDSYVSGNGNKTAELNGNIYFAADNGSNGAELWKTNGTAAGTVMVKNINSFGASSPDWFITINGTIYFVATGSSGRELYKSDGTADGTVLVKDIRSGGDASPHNLTNVNGTLFFLANNGINGDELWKSNGTAAGTVLVKDIKPGSATSVSIYERKMAVLGNTVFFVADNGVNSEEVWKSDGTAAGTVLLKDINPGGTGDPFELTVMNNMLYFTAYNSSYGKEIWKSDGTTAGTVLVKDLQPGSATSDPNNLEAVNNTLFFAATVGNDRELYKTDGTAGGTVLVKNINPNPGYYSFPAGLTEVNGTLFFTAKSITTGYSSKELWKSDGTSAGTVQVKDFSSESNPSAITNIKSVNNRLFFSFFEPWKSDGTPAKTFMLDNINPSGNSNPTGYTGLGTTVLFWATDGSTGMELYKYAVCYVCPIGPGGRVAASLEAAPTSLQLTLLPNPVHNTLTVDIAGAASQPLHLHLMTVNGELIENRQLTQTGAVERQVFDVSRQSAGILLLRATTNEQTQTVKILKTN